jgi:hypothetical protein
MSDQEWLSNRRRHVCSTDAGPILGVGRFHSALDVYAEKIGQGAEVQVTDAMRWGNLLEEACAQAYAQDTGRPVAPPPERFVSRDVGYPAGASVDRLIDAADVADGMGILECKTTSLEVEDLEDVPEDWVVQLGHQLLTLDLGWGSLAVLTFHKRTPMLRTFDFHRNTRFEGHLKSQCGAFWERVQRRLPPEPTGLGDELATLRALYPRETAGKRVMLEPHLVEVANTYEHAGAEEKAFHDLRETAKLRLIAAIGDAEIGILPDARRFTLRMKKGCTYTTTRKPGRVLLMAKKRP